MVQKFVEQMLVYSNALNQNETVEKELKDLSKNGTKNLLNNYKVFNSGRCLKRHLLFSFLCWKVEVLKYR